MKDNNKEKDARDSLREFLEWGDSDDETLGQEIKIVLASAEFSKELTTTVLWLNERGLDIRCVRMRPYDHDGQVLLAIQTIIPTPETEEYQIRIREKRQKEQVAKKSARDLSKYDVTIGGKQFLNQNKRYMMFRLVSGVFDSGGNPQQVMEALPSSKLKVFEGRLDAEQIREQLMQEDTGRKVLRTQRFFCADGEPFQIEDRTYVLSNQWGHATLGAGRKLAEMFPALNIEFKQTGTVNA